MDRADAGAGEHGDHRFGDHRHVEDDPVALGDSEILQHGAEHRHLVQEFRIRNRALRAGDGAVVDDRRLPGPAAGHMPVDRVVAGIDDAAGEPAAIDAGLRVEHPIGGLDPVDALGGVGPETLRVGLPAGVDLVIAASLRRPRLCLHGVSPLRLRCGIHGCAVLATAQAAVSGDFRPSLPRESHDHRSPLLRGGCSGGDPDGLGQGRVLRARPSLPAADGARRLAGPIGGDHAADPHRSGHRDGLGLSAELGTPEHPDPGAGRDFRHRCSAISSRRKSPRRR